jgi:hypothetical protein
MKQAEAVQCFPGLSSNYFLPLPYVKNDYRIMDSMLPDVFLVHELPHFFKRGIVLDSFFIPERRGRDLP